jgi:signal peptidase II
MSSVTDEAPVAPMTAGGTAHPRPPFPTARTIATRFFFVALLLAFDLWSKAAVFAWMERLDEANALVRDDCGGGHLRHPIFDGWFTFMLSLNPGAAFGQLDKWPWLLVCGRLLAAVFLVWLLVRTPSSGKRWLVVAFVLVLAGALGNLYDNLLRARTLDLDRFYQGRTFAPVRDFLDVYFATWHWHFPTFNVADSCITVGAILLLLTSFVHKKTA